MWPLPETASAEVKPTALHSNRAVVDDSGLDHGGAGYSRVAVHRDRAPGNRPAGKTGRCRQGECRPGIKVQSAATKSEASRDPWRSPTQRENSTRFHEVPEIIQIRSKIDCSTVDQQIRDC